MSSEIETRVLTTNKEMQQVQRLEKEVWNMDALPLHQTITAAQNGGLILGAFIGDELIGFSYGFAGFNKGKSYLCSHMLGIHPHHQDKGIGARLKQEQMEIAREMGYDLIVWTYDPLESRNGYLNLSKLHAICSTYVEDCYGEMEDSFNSGLPTDRFKVEWWINSPHVMERHSIEDISLESSFRWEMTEDKHPKLINVEETLENITFPESVVIPVPACFQKLKSENNELAIDWRFKTRQIFQTLFSNGYAVASLSKSENQLVHHYVLVPKKTLQLNDKAEEL
ncbi:GNAT family N-acetyltransferase [Bacillus sp. M6-12]|uniref:GNAT family N-acetyltransferase n=1 Tax=Bacillus sp. M6-12 TaxID=2054166 RepID=UPI0015E06E5E|nr:GNAT family N-acetyltransferase [Bacillus sp. M6-12]